MGQICIRGGRGYYIPSQNTRNNDIKWKLSCKTLFKVSKLQCGKKTKSPNIKPCGVTFDDHLSVINTNKITPFLVVLPFHFVTNVL